MYLFRIMVGAWGQVFGIVVKTPFRRPVSPVRNLCAPPGSALDSCFQVMCTVGGSKR